MDLSPARQKLLSDVVDIQERMLSCVRQIFSGLSQSSDPEVVLISEEALNHLTRGQDTLEAMIDGLNETKH